MADGVCVRPLCAELVGDFRRVMACSDGTQWCQCVAWWVPTWEGWGAKPAEDNHRLRSELFDRGAYDGYLGYLGEVPVAWCQVGPRDRLKHLVRTFELAPDASTWAITCFFVAPDFRRKGVAREMLQGVLSDLQSRGVALVEAYPKCDQGLDADDLWNGPEAIFRNAGFKGERTVAEHYVLSCSF